MLGQFTKQKFTQIVLFFFLANSAAFAATVLPTPHLSRSLDLQNRYQTALQGEQVLILETERERFIGLMLEQRTSQPQGGILLLHDVGQTPDWPFLLKQTREFLPDVGWTTLAIDLPTPLNAAIGLLPLDSEQSQTTVEANADANSEDAEARVMARIAAGLKQLNSQGLFNIVILGYGDGGYWGSKYLTERLSEQEEDGYALILYEAPPLKADMPAMIEQLKIPVLDIYMNDSDFAALQAKLRKGAAMRAEHPDYLQIHDASRHGHLSKPDIDRSTRRVWGWLKNHAAGYEAELVNKRVP